MAVQTPHFPDLLFGAAERLRTWENALVAHLGQHGFRELRPSLVTRDVADGTVRFFDGESLVALRWDFTRSLAALLAARFAEPPERVSYAGAVFRRPGHGWEPVERFEVGCERIQLGTEDANAADLELARLLLAVPRLVGLRGGILQLGHAALLNRPLEAEGVPASMAAEIVKALHQRAPHRVASALAGHPAAERLVAHVATLRVEPGGPASLDGVARSPYAELLSEERAELSRAAAALAPMMPEGLELRVDLADVAGAGFYTGPTLRLWAPGARQELAAGGRYDQLFPSLGRDWRAAGFCVRLTPLLALRETHPELFLEAP